MIELRWIGGPTVELRLGSFRLLTDPMFAEGAEAFRFARHPSTGAVDVPVARLTPLPPVAAEPLDLLLLSHLHADHFDTVAQARLPKGSLVVAPVTQVETVGRAGFTNVHGLDWWAPLELTRGAERLTVTAVPARHAADDALNARLGVVNGYVIRYARPPLTFTLYWTGDTVWFDGLAQIEAFVGAPDVLLAHMGAVGRDGPFGRFTLDAAEAARVIALFQPQTFIPIHHHTFAHYLEPATDLPDRYPSAARCTRILREGETWCPPADTPPHTAHDDSRRDPTPVSL